MNATVLTKTYEAPPVDEREILRYSGVKPTSTASESDIAALKELMNEMLSESASVLTYKVCYATLPVSTDGNTCDFGAFKVASKNLSKKLEGCDSAVFFAATIGIGIDRLIAKYNHVSPAKALMLQAVGAERIESLVEIFCDELESSVGPVKPRYSPGYGDLPLEFQRTVFSLLDCPRKIGITLNESLFMTPSKSVTAIVGIKNKCFIEEASENGSEKPGLKSNQKHHCGECRLVTCPFREV
ncbi:MAG: vitamin B12 dependent-methionine synthase activation domain-containing protein [Eubacteriales bacterium]|nr:vitamin B12 dependent-methionine synthase activation domain-containing protein [Eubacteriales bacterium]